MIRELEFLRHLEQQVQRLNTVHRDLKYDALATEIATVRSVVNERLIEVLEVEQRGQHRTRMSDSSLYDEVCMKCGATDARSDDRLRQPCLGERSRI